jgi:hypothetical protein
MTGSINKVRLLAAIAVVLLLTSCGSKQENSQASYQGDALDIWVQKQEAKYGQREQPTHKGKYDIRDFAKNLNDANATPDQGKRAAYLISALEAVPKMKPALRKEFNYEIEGAFYSLKNAVLDFSVIGNLKEENILSNKMITLARKIWGADSRMMIVALDVRADYLKRAKKNEDYAKVVEKGLGLSRQYKL